MQAIREYAVVRNGQLVLNLPEYFEQSEEQRRCGTMNKEAKMIEVTVKVPEYVSDIVSETGQALYVEALNEVAGKRLSHTRKRLDDLMIRIAGYELRHGRTYSEFSRNLPDTAEAHEDWAEWSYLNAVSGKLADKIRKLEMITGR